MRPRRKPSPGYRKRVNPVSAAIRAAADYETPTYPTRPDSFIELKPTVFGFTAPEPPLSINRTAGKHYAQFLQHKRAWEDAAAIAATAAEDELKPFRGQRIELTFALPVARPTQCDAGNYISGVSVKAAQDGITRTGLLIPDDTSTWLKTHVVFYKASEKQEVRVRVCTTHPDNPDNW